MKGKLMITLLSAMLISASVHAAMKPKNAIVARKSVMKVIGLNFGPMGKMVKGKIPFNDDVFKANARRVKLVAEMPIEDYFPKGSEKGKGTTVTPAIWKEWGEFKEILENMRKESAKLVVAAKSGDRKAMRKQFVKTAKTCKNCHDDFREK